MLENTFTGRTFYSMVMHTFIRTHARMHQRTHAQMKISDCDFNGTTVHSVYTRTSICMKC